MNKYLTNRDTAPKGTIPVYQLHVVQVNTGPTLYLPEELDNTWGDDLATQINTVYKTIKD